MSQTAEGTPIADHSPSVVAPVAVVADLIRLRGAATSRPELVAVDSRVLASQVYERLGITASHWPLSLASTCTALGASPRAIMGPNYLDPLQPDHLPGPALDGSASPLTRFQASSIPISRHVYKMVLASGYAIALGIAIGESWHDLASAVSGECRLPDPCDVLYDGTCLVLVGWDDDRSCFRFRSARGPTWGREGYGWLPYDYAAQSSWCHEAVVIASL